MFKPADLFKLDHPIAQMLFDGCRWPWEALIDLGEKIEDLVGATQIVKGQVAETAILGDGPLFIDEGATIEAGVFLGGPAYIGPGATIRHGAYVRSSLVMLDGALLGHAGEAKNAIMMPRARAPHFAYVGDSILGNEVNLGAGTKLSNLAITSTKDVTGARNSIEIPLGDDLIDTGLAKLGAIIGDDSQTGCNSVMNPGTILGRDCLVYPNLVVRKGFYRGGTILKLRQDIESVARVPPAR